MATSTHSKFKKTLLISTGITLICILTVTLITFQMTISTSTKSNQIKAGQNSKKLSLLKNNFIKQIQTVAQKQEAITPQLKKELFMQFAPLFPNGEDDKKVAKAALTEFFDCHYYFWQDAVVTYNLKVKTKSDNLLKCANLSGDYFERSTLFTADNIKSDDLILEKLAKHQPLPGMDNKNLKISKEQLLAIRKSKALESQSVRSIFE